MFFSVPSLRVPTDSALLRSRYHQPVRTGRLMPLLASQLLRSSVLASASLPGLCHLFPVGPRSLVLRCARPCGSARSQVPLPCVCVCGGADTEVAPRPGPPVPSLHLAARPGVPAGGSGLCPALRRGCVVRQPAPHGGHFVSRISLLPILRQITSCLFPVCGARGLFSIVNLWILIHMCFSSLQVFIISSF